MKKDSQKKIWESYDRRWSAKYEDGQFNLYEAGILKASSKYLGDMIMYANTIIHLRSLARQPKEK